VDVRPHTEERAIALRRNLDLTVHFTGVIGRLQMLAAVFDPLHRLANLHSSKRNQKILGIKLPPDAKTAAKIRLDEVDLMIRYVKHRSQDSAVEMRHLGGTPDAQFATTGLITGNQTARFQRIPRVPVHGKGGCAGVVGSLPGRVDISDVDGV